MEQLSFTHFSTYTKKPADGTFVHNMKLPVHRWFRYSAGFSAEWVKKEIHNYHVKIGRSPNIFDPFTGTGTVLLSAEEMHCLSIGVESHPFVSRVAKSKLLWRSSIDSFNHFALAVLEKAQRLKDEEESYPVLIKKCFSPAYLMKLNKLKKAYHTMLVAYFVDMAKIWYNLRYVMKPNSTVCFVIGDSAPYGIYVPVDKWLGELAISAGFKEYYFEKIRDRNIKWKNRKHRVPLQEGCLWIKG